MWVQMVLYPTKHNQINKTTMVDIPQVTILSFGEDYCAPYNRLIMNTTTMISNGCTQSYPVNESIVFII